MENLTQKIVGTARDPKKYKDYKEENGRSIEAKTGAYEANIKKLRHLIYYHRNSVLELIPNNRSDITIGSKTKAKVAKLPLWENRKLAKLGKLLKYIIYELV
jgi:hypothetical protein